MNDLKLVAARPDTLDRVIKGTVLFVGPWPPPFGGIASNIYEIAPGIRDAGYNVVTLSLSDGMREIVDEKQNLVNIRCNLKMFFLKNIFRILRCSLRFIKIRNGLSLRNYLRGVVHAEKINELVSQYSVSFVFAYTDPALYAVPFISKRELRYPRVYLTLYAGFSLYRDYYQKERKFLKYAVETSDEVLSCSRYCLNLITGFLGTDRRGKVIYNSANHQVYHPKVDGQTIRRKFQIPRDAILVMTMARMDRDMGYDFIIKNLGKILSADQKIHLLLVGAAGSLQTDVLAISEAEARVHCAFNITFEEKPFFFAACDIFTAPSRESYACLGISNIEAMMCGKPVLSSASGGHTEVVVDGITGFLIPFKSGEVDIEVYTRRLRDLSGSEEIRRAQGSAGRARALERFTNDRIVAEHLALFGAH